MNTLFLGRVMIRLDRVGSTNDHAKALLRYSSTAEGTVVVATAQDTGRGQRGNTWVSEPGKNLTFSVVLFPSFLSPDVQFYLNKAVSLAVADVVAELSGGSVSLKWPNDILLDGRKVAGILIENLVGASNWQAIVGVGLNVNQAAFPAGLPLATSLSRESGQAFSLDTVLDRLCELLEARYLRLKGNITAFDDEYLKRQLGYGEFRLYRIGGEVVQAKINGIDATGKLLLTAISGQQWSCSLQEVEWLLEN